MAFLSNVSHIYILSLYWREVGYICSGYRHLVYISTSKTKRGHYCQNSHLLLKLALDIINSTAHYRQRISDQIRN